MKKEKDSKKERDFQKDLIRTIKNIFPNSIVMKTDPNYIQGIPDLIVLVGSKWFGLEVKRSKQAKHRPNQDYYISKMNKMSYAKFVYPENKEEILNELQKSFKS